MQTILLLSLFFCLFLGDFTHLSTKWMLDAKRVGQPIFPILCHAIVHGCLMSIALLFFVSIQSQIYWHLVEFQIITHFIIDVWKGKMNVWFPELANPVNKLHWYVFGIDQFFHATVIIIMVGKII